ncbi:unnamed protein product [Kuraishia capsulata CBS 1993]|uniref:GYF domain-containing protein n=1 Tax=Kuraishia capsulata CBS 1993 TaxID=1382522 RepID=W6ML67_9ASCO|nr:uncharacterized protein KUCA_T00002817001 [Kuraishia capsulata CBS 1993]CDK26843.1 unnamed protein product [Kuraishia capsulata CBS 1993]
MTSKERILTEDQLLLQDINTRNSRVRMQGYDSDSLVEDSSDEEANSGDEKTERTGEKADDNDDMFASDTETKQTRKPNTLDLDEFEKNLGEDVEVELANLKGGLGDAANTSESEDDTIDKSAMYAYFNNPEEEVRDVDRAKIKRSRGPKIEKFNLQKEAKEGVFDESGNFIRNKRNSDKEGNDDDDDDDDDDDEEEALKNSKDSWLQGLDKASIAKAREAETHRKEEREKKLKSERDAMLSMDLKDVFAGLIELLQPAESIMEALQRLQGSRKVLQKKNKKQKVKSNQEEQLIKIKIQTITDNSEFLTKKAYRNVHGLTREELMRMYSRAAGKPYENGKKRGYDESFDQDEEEDDHPDEAHPRIWEYKWQDNEEVYGPFTTEEMAYWSESYFVDQNVIARKVGDNGQFVDISLISFK